MNPAQVHLASLCWVSGIAYTWLMLLAVRTMHKKNRKMYHNAELSNNRRQRGAPTSIHRHLVGALFYLLNKPQS